MSVPGRLAVPFLGVLLFAAGCNQYPDSYPPPEQRQPLTPGQAGEAMSFVKANDPDAESYFIHDVRGLEGGQWRWTGPEPAFHFLLDTVEKRKLVVNFTLAGATFKTTGPVTVTFRVNDQVAGKVRYETQGKKHFEKVLDAGLLKAGEDTIVSLHIDPPWVSPRNGVKLGVIFSSAGFLAP